MSQSFADPADVFRQEAAEILEQLEVTLLDLERSPGDKALVDAAFRAMHTIKGSGAMFGFDRLSAFTHGFETTFDLVRKGQIEPGGALVAVALRAMDFIRALIEAPDTAEPAEGAAILADLERVASAAGARTAVGAEPRPDAGVAFSYAAPPVTWRIGVRFNGPVLANGTDPLRLLRELRDLGPCEIRALVDAVPPLADLDPDVCYVRWEIELGGAVSRDDIESVFMFTIDDMELSIEAASAPAPAPAPACGPDRPSAPPVALVPKAALVAADTPDAAAKSPPSETVRVPAERLDDLMDRVGELVIQQARLAQFAETNGHALLKSIAEDIGRLAAGLRDTTMNIRLVPIGTLFNRFRRLVHDLSRDLGKPVELVTEGEDTELDKTVIERLADPLTHIIRNSLDHGLELPEGRLAAGKTAAGRLRLAARHVGAEVQITIGDDGRGLDRARIRQKAEEAGLMAPGASIADAELFRMIFEPGFSTAREISSLSGRGVGMDVVKRTIEALRGTVDLSTEPGRGTDVVLRLPLTLAIIEGLLVELAGNRYVIPLGAVQECVELDDDEDSSMGGRSLLDIRGELVPFIRLRELFGKAAPSEPHQKVVIVAASDMRVGLVVDRIIGSHQTVIKSLSKLHADVKTFSGATILADGSAALIFDIPQLVERGLSQARRATLARQDAA